MNEYLYLPVDCLDFHPDNIRRDYPEKDVAKMAASIRARGGVEQALLVTPIPDTADRYYVVDGNMRLAGARRLGDNAPPLKCDVRSGLSPVQQHIIMLTTTTFHFNKNAIDEALAYKKILDETGWSVRKLSKQTGITEASIHNRLILLQLDEPIRQLIANGKLSKDPRVVRALLKIPDPAQRIALAERLVANRSNIDVIVRSAQRVAELAKNTAPDPVPKQPQAVTNVHPSVQTPLGAAIYHLRANAGFFDAYADLLLRIDPDAADDARGMARINEAVVRQLEEVSCSLTPS